MLPGQFLCKVTFTNVPLNETINICAGSLFKDIHSVCDFNKDPFRKFLSMSVKDCFFSTFNKGLYLQTGCAAMGTPLGPTLANAFLCFHETEWLRNYPPEFRSIMYRRYADDTFLVLSFFSGKKEHVAKYLIYVNKNIKTYNILLSASLGGELPLFILP